MAWEKTALDLAEQAGIPVPARRLERAGERSAHRDYLDVQAAIEDHSGNPA